jgi:hypothetical protein
VVIPAHTDKTGPSINVLRQYTETKSLLSTLWLGKRKYDNVNVCQVISYFFFAVLFWYLHENRGQ